MFQITLLITFLVSSPLAVYGDSLPLIQPPLSHLDEGVETKLTPDQLKTIQPWAENTKSRVEELRLQVMGLPKKDRETQIVAGLDRIVKSSSPIENETYMRFVLNRALKIREVLAREVLAPQEPDQWLCLRLLENSMELALSFYGNTRGANQTLAPADFGRAYFSFLSGLSKSVFDASTQYQIARLIVGFLQWDLYRDDNRISYAVEIRRLNDLFTRLPEAAPQSDLSSLTYVRQIKRLLGQLKSPDATFGGIGTQAPKTPTTLATGPFSYCGNYPEDSSLINRELSSNPIIKTDFLHHTAEEGDIVFIGDMSISCGKAYPVRVRKVIADGPSGAVMGYTLGEIKDRSIPGFELGRLNTQIFFPKACKREYTDFCAGEIAFIADESVPRATRYVKVAILGINVDNSLLLGWLEGDLQGQITIKSVKDWTNFASTSRIKTGFIVIGSEVRIRDQKTAYRVVGKTPLGEFLLEPLDPNKTRERVLAPNERLLLIR